MLGTQTAIETVAQKAIPAYLAQIYPAAADQMGLPYPLRKSGPLADYEYRLRDDRSLPFPNLPTPSLLPLPIICRTKKTPLVHLRVPPKHAPGTIHAHD